MLKRFFSLFVVVLVSISISCSSDSDIADISFTLDKTVIDVSSYGVPYDITQSKSGITALVANYGSYTFRPRITALTDSKNNLQVLWVEGNGADGGVSSGVEKLHLVRISSGKVKKHKLVESLGYSAGFTSDDFGNIYYASAKNTNMAQNAIPSSYIANIIKIYKYKSDYTFVLSEDALLSDKASKPWIGYAYNPLIFGSSRLAYTNDNLMLVFAHNGGGHQGEDNIPLKNSSLSNSSSPYASIKFSPSHSMGQRLIAKGDSFIRATVGDAYPRAIELARFKDDKSISKINTFYIKGDSGDNNIFGTHFGGIDFIDDTIMIAASAENSTSLEKTGYYGKDNLNVFVQLVKDKDKGLELLEDGDSLGSGDTKSKGLNWITDYTGTTHALNPKLKSYKNVFVLTWEKWDSEKDTTEVCYVVLSKEAEAQENESCLGKSVRYNRGDDLFLDSESNVSWIIGDSEKKTLIKYSLVE